MKRSVCGLLSMAALSAASSARASHFDSDNELVFQPNALYTQSFETGPAPPGGTLVADPSSINGAQLLQIPAGGAVELTIPLPPRNVSASVSIYMRGGFAKMDLFAALAGPGLPYTGATLFPTGRVTSDGWVEMKSAPISLPMGRATSFTLTITNDAFQSSEVDGLEVVRDGEYSEARACSPPDASTCGPGDVCAIGYCIHGAAYVPPLPSEADRANLPAWLGTALYGNFGGVATRPPNLPGALATLRATAAATDATSFWSGIAAAWQRMRHNHSVPAIGFSATDVLPICFVQGDADLSHHQVPSDPVYPDVLVSHGLPGQMAGLVPGDRLVAVNGMHPAAFRRSLVGLAQGNLQSADPNQYEFALEILNEDIRQWATDITVIHCDPGTKQCGAPYMIPVASLPRVPADAIECDNRPAYHLASGGPDPVSHNLNNQVFYGPLADTSPSEALYGFMFDSLYTNAPGDPWQGPLAAIRQEASGVVLDVRTGYGGYARKASEITGPFLPASTPLASWFAEPYFSNPHFTTADGVTEYDIIAPYTGFTVGSPDPKPGLKAALLTSHDVSANDLLMYGMSAKTAGATNVRSFGTRGCGAFGYIIPLRYAGGSIFLGVGSGDSFTPQGAWNDGTGLEPDEHVVPTQSDLLAGRDTAYERALAWLRCSTCDAPGGH